MHNIDYGVDEDFSDVEMVHDGHSLNDLLTLTEGNYSHSEFDSQGRFYTSVIFKHTTNIVF